jgi:hypothetical protein
MRTSPKRRSDAQLAAAFARERRRQLRGLLMLGLVALLWILFRADLAAIFHPGWWRI